MGVVKITRLLQHWITREEEGKEFVVFFKAPEKLERESLRGLFLLTFTPGVQPLILLTQGPPLPSLTSHTHQSFLVLPNRKKVLKDQNLLQSLNLSLLLALHINLPLLCLLSLPHPLTSNPLPLYHIPPPLLYLSLGNPYPQGLDLHQAGSGLLHQKSAEVLPGALKNLPLFQKTSSLPLPLPLLLLLQSIFLHSGLIH